MKPGPLTAAEIIIWSLDRQPEDWKVDRYRLHNENLQVLLWIANGWSFVKEERGHAPLKRGDRRRIWKAYERWAAVRLKTKVLEEKLT